MIFVVVELFLHKLKHMFPIMLKPIEICNSVRGKGGFHLVTYWFQKSENEVGSWWTWVNKTNVERRNLNISAWMMPVFYLLFFSNEDPCDPMLCTCFHWTACSDSNYTVTGNVWIHFARPLVVEAIYIPLKMKVSSCSL